jgi:hypothetical protein
VSELRDLVHAAISGSADDWAWTSEEVHGVSDDVAERIAAEPATWATAILGCSEPVRVEWGAASKRRERDGVLRARYTDTEDAVRQFVEVTAGRWQLVCREVHALPDGGTLTTGWETAQ